MAEKIFPRNLTARAATVIVGNPVTTRLESGVGNCFPGLEWDHRNLDRRFFPGLVFDFGPVPAVLNGVEPNDPALEPDPEDDETIQRRVPALSRAVSDRFAVLSRTGGQWALVEIAQGGRSIDVSRGVFLDDPNRIWRVVRSLERDQVMITLEWRRATRAGRSRARQTVRLTHYRRRYVNPDTGTISPVYKPGELTQSLCSPWQHDFRDCACNYWASNHPDIALGEDLPGKAELPSGASEDPETATQPLDWLRADRRSRVAASGLDFENDDRRLRHYQINSEWQNLAFVLGGKEISAVYAPRDERVAAPFATPEDLAQQLADLCGLEHVVVLEYLYAYFSLREPTEGRMNRELTDALLFARHELLTVAISEMRHLRWANQILWSVEKLAPKVPKRGPVLDLATEVPGRDGRLHPRQLRPLLPEVLDDFIAIEKPSGRLDGAYSRVVSTLSSGHPEVLLQLARQIVADGMEHYSRFREIKVVLAPHVAAGSSRPPVYLRPIELATRREAKAALDLYHGILRDLAAAYARGDMEDAANIVNARDKMTRLEAEASSLARRNLGVPFF